MNALAIVFGVEGGFFVERLKSRGGKADHLSTTPHLKLTGPLVSIRITPKQQWGLALGSGLWRELLE